MRVLLVDANGSGRLIPLAVALRRNGHGSVLLDPSGAGAKGVPGIMLATPDPLAAELMPHIRSSTTSVRNGQNVVRAVHQILSAGAPEMVVGFAGEGTTMFVREVVPDAKVVTIAPDHYVPLAREQAPQPGGVQADESGARLVRRADTMPALMEILHADWTLAPTAYQRDQYPWVLRNRMSIVHPGLDASWWAKPASGWRAPSDPADTDAWVGSVPLTTHGDLITLSCGSPAGEDGADLALETARLLLAARTDRRVLLLSESAAGWPTQGELARRVDPGRFHLIAGAAPADVRRALWASSVHVAVGWRSGLWDTLLAALAAGTPVAGVGMAAAGVIRHGETGYLGAPEGRRLADVVEWMVAAGDTLGQVTRAAQTMVSERFDSTAAAESMVQILRQVGSGAAQPVRPPAPNFV